MIQPVSCRLSIFAVRSSVGVHAAELQNTEPPMNSASARIKNRQRQGVFERSRMRTGISSRVLIANPEKLQQHVRRGNYADGDESRAPAEGCRDTARQYRADGSADAVGTETRLAPSPRRLGSRSDMMA